MEQLKENVTEGVICANLSYLTSDASEFFMLEAENKLNGIYKFQQAEKQGLKTCKRILKSMSKSIDKTLNNEEASEGFGDIADFLREVIYHASKIMDDDNRIKAISQLKLLIK